MLTFSRERWLGIAPCWCQKSWWKAQNSKTDRFWFWGRCSSRSRGSLESWSTLFVRSLPHDLLMGGISLAGSQHPHVILFFFISLSLFLSLFLRTTLCSTGALWLHLSAWASKTESGRRLASSGEGTPCVLTPLRGRLWSLWTEQVQCHGHYWLSV